MPRIQHKRGTSANLTSVNPTPLAGELVWDSTENAIKIGDGSTAWTSLAYVTATPRSHVHDGGEITTGTVAYARLPVGSTASTVCAGDDSRLTDARTPTAHKSTHATGGSDALTPADIGAAPAASPTFTGTATFEGVILADDSTSTSTPVYSFTGDQNCGIAHPATDAIGLVETGFERFRVSSAGVDVYQLSAGTDVVRVRLNNESGTGQVTLIGYGASFAGSTVFSLGAGSSSLVSASGVLGVGCLANQPLVLATNNSERMRITGAGSVGIGRTSPASALDVNGVITVAAGTAAAPALVFSGDSNTGIAQIGGADTWSVVTAGVERVRVTSGGTLAVTTNLEIHGGATAFPTADTSAFIGRTDATGSAPFDQAGSLVYRPRVSSTAGRSSHIFYTGSPSVERLRINETGAAIFSGVITVSATAGSAGSYLPSLTISGDANTGFGQVSGESDTASVFTAGHERVRVDSSGRVGINTASANASVHIKAPAAQSKGIIVERDSADAAGIDYNTTGGFVAGVYGQNGGGLRLFVADGAGGTVSEAIRVTSLSRVGIGTTSPTGLLDINSDTMRLRTARTPASATAAGNAGDICWDASYLYICTATNTWRRIAHSTW